ncbi:MAG TPA: acetyl-CoA hydrolase/transferase C-terminal domain-containing protein [Pseudomonadales bacterium]|nr:acetyl-CoA hydrolase/transferase C-terminal domain-containing protein [Pseudomonadales bacterium]
MPQKLSAKAFTSVLAPGMRVFVPGASNEPLGLVEAIVARPECAAGVTFVQFPLPGMNHTDFPGLHPDARMESFFLSGALRKSFDAGRLDFLPMHMRRVYDHVATCRSFDLVLIQVGMDANGDLRHGPNVDFLEAALGNGVRVVAELNRRLEPAAGAPSIDMDAIDLLVETEHALPELALPVLDDAARAIGALVAELIPDGACIQTGIGTIPAAVLGALGDHNDLGMHGGLIDDAGFALVEKGVITGLRKAIDREFHVVGMALGTAALYGALADWPDVTFRPARYTHEASVIAELEQFVSINSAVEVDLLGQVSAEMVAGRQISGTGGSVDFMRGAATSPGGRSIVAMTATARGGELSRIVPFLRPGTAVTAARTDVDCVVTEFGVAKLKGCSVDARARALIEVAAPAFRDELTAAWKERRARM